MPLRRINLLGDFPEKYAKYEKSRISAKRRDRAAKRCAFELRLSPAGEMPSVGGFASQFLVVSGFLGAPFGS
jgi:hypothetical protein